jgi:soluble lytic murein transglycosylase
LASTTGPASAATVAASTPPALPAEPLDAVREDARYVKATALRSVGLADWADGELWELARRSSGDAPRLYAVSAAFAEEARHHMALRILRRDFFLTARAGHELVPRRFWEMFYPIGWRAEMTSAATRAGLDPFFVAAVVREESSYDPRARSRVGARGLMQLMPDTARPLARAQGLAFREGALLYDPGANLEMGTTYIAQLVRDFGEPRVAVAAYNAGPRRAREWWAARRSDDVEVWVEQIPFNETRAFVKRVMLSWAEYRRVYAPAS